MKFAGGFFFQVKNIPRAKQMNINVATWGRLLKRSTPTIQNQQSGTDMARRSPSNDSFCGTSSQPLQLVFETSSDEFEVVVAPGENPDLNVVGLSGARPLGKFKIFFYYYRRGDIVLPNLTSDQSKPR